MFDLVQMDDRVNVQRAWFKDYNFNLVKTVDQLKNLVDICIKKGIASLDCETTGVDNRIYPDEHFEDGIKTPYGIRTVDKVVGLCISFDGHNGYYVPLAHEPEDSGNLPWFPAWEEVSRLVHNCRIIFHNKRFDAEFLYPPTGKKLWKTEEFEDTMYIAKIISPLKSNPAGLKPLSKIHCGIDMVELDELFTEEKKEQLKREKSGYNFSLLHPKEGLEYGCSDGIFTYKLYFILREKLREEDMPLYNLEKSFSNVMNTMERNRVHVDVEKIRQLFTDCTNAMREVGDLIREHIEAKTGRTGKWLTLNIGSPSQLSNAFFTDPEGLKIKPTAEMKNNGDQGWGVSYDDNSNDDDEDGEQQFSVADEVLKSLNKAYAEKHMIKKSDEEKDKESLFNLVLEYRHYDKMKGSYVEKLLHSHDKYGDVRPSFNQLGTDTTRLSCRAGKIEDGFSGVNFQGIPRDSDDDKPELFKQIRTVIIPRPGYVLVKIDYAGEELRVVTNMSGDPIWTDSFLNKDGDVHSITAKTLYGRQNITKDERNRGKRCNFAFIYGGGSGAISRNVNCSMEDAQRHMDNLRTDVPVLMKYVDHQKAFARKHKCIYTAFGRRIPIPTIDHEIKAIRKKAERCAINYTIQATSADVLKLAMCYLDKRIRELGWEDKVRYVLTVHDEVVFEVRPEALMEVVPLLDEWMVLPWKLPKAHGRQWVVPLETEPGIDIHWRARYDFFKMTRGDKVEANKIDEKGNYKGDLKKETYFANGRIYQEIPDFLKDHIQRLPLDEKGDPILGIDQSKVFQVPGAVDNKPEEIEAVEQTKELPPHEESLINDSIKEVQPKPEPIPEPVRVEPKKETMDLDINIDVDDIPSSKPSSVQDDGDDLDFSGEVSYDGSDEESNPSEPPPKSTPTEEIQKSESVIEEKKETKAIVEGETILRWTFRAVPSKLNMRKLLAVCVLCEGQTPLRIVNTKEQIVFSEEKGIRINPDEFKVVASMFGLG